MKTISLAPQQKTAIELKTQEDYELMMNAAQATGWTDERESSPLEGNRWVSLREDTCMTAGTLVVSGIEDRFETCSLKARKRAGWTILTPYEFLEQNGLTRNDISN